LPKKLFERVIASGNHLLTQVKDNQPTLRRKLELGAAGRKPSGRATSKAKGRNRWETRELTVLPAKAWFRHTPLERMDTRPLAHREWQPLRARRCLRQDASRIRKNPDIVARLRSFAYNLIRASGADNIQNARYRAALDITFALNILGDH